MQLHKLESTKARLDISSDQLKKFQSLVDCQSRNLGLSKPEVFQAIKTMDALLWKFTFAGVHLERLWEYRQSIDIQNVLNSSFQTHSLSSHEVTDAAIELEGFLYQTRAMLDVLMLHILISCRVDFYGKMSRKVFRKKIKDVPPPHDQKATTAVDYLMKYVFADGMWGNFLCSLRDRIAHLDCIRPSSKSQETVGNTKLDWPTVDGKTFHRLTQDFENHVWDTLTTVIPPLWDQTWKSGPYIEGMWD